jgi:hypothetical protein|tara:strand:+ start:546 stop:755 length:210 start_codon:yes stop_codon:yes gene_type:complete
MEPLFCQSYIGGPSFGWLMSQSCILVDERAKKNAAKSKKGTVGSKGNTIPIRAKRSVIKPKNNHIIFIN